MMKSKTYFLFLIFFALSLSLLARNNNKVYIDKNGAMRWTADKSEAVFYGVNYTLPFAHAYRAMNYLGVDHKEAIDRDVYHFARLGFNAYRIHIWDVEISDSIGNLINNEHLDLLDYLISKLKERNIQIVITGMTNFGNGYPERNVPSDAFSNKYNGRAHTDTKAIAAEQRYIAQLVSHINHYTGLAYKNDPDIIGFEINNEPRHPVSTEQTQAYIQSMIKSIKGTGCEKPIFYNVSHNIDKAEAYFSSDIQGTTYQWYPIGLVANHKRYGNFLPYVDHFPIPYTQLKGYNNKAKLVYEFSPADNMYTFLYPAMARSFRTAGFCWITQFAYDPIDMAAYNTEYQTHYLNLAYTPQKAIGMKIAGEVARNVPLGKSYGTYPESNKFESFMVSYVENLSMMNTAEKYFYTNNTTIAPVDAVNLNEIAGFGSSPIIQYHGTGVYFFDKLQNGIWRLEVMPDALEVNDPFEKTSLKKEVVKIFWNEHTMNINLPDLGKSFIVTPLNKGNNFSTTAANGDFKIQPGTYLLCKLGKSIDQYISSSTFRNITLGEFVAPKSANKSPVVVHHPKMITEQGTMLAIEAQIMGCEPDSVVVYNNWVNFWSSKNPYLTMTRNKGFNYSVFVPEDQIWPDSYQYNIVVCVSGKQYTYPQDVSGGPLDWDFFDKQYYQTKVVDRNSPIIIFDPLHDSESIEAGAIDNWSWIKPNLVRSTPLDAYRLQLKSEAQNAKGRDKSSTNFKPRQIYLRKYIKNEVQGRIPSIDSCTMVSTEISNVSNYGQMKISFICSNGYTYTVAIEKAGAVKIPFSAFKQDSTILLPVAYPVFMPKYFVPEKSFEFDPGEIEYLMFLTSENDVDKPGEVQLNSIWFE